GLSPVSADLALAQAPASDPAGWRAELAGRARDARGSRAHRGRMVGRSRGATRLLRGCECTRRGVLDLSRAPRPGRLVPAWGVRVIPSYAELHCLSNYTFLRGASCPEELVDRAAGLGYHALAITDECSVAGVVRAHVAAKEAKLKLIVGSEVTLADGMKIVLLAANRTGYERMCELITVARRAAPKGEYRLTRGDFAEGTEGLLALWIPPSAVAGARVEDEAAWIARRFPGRAWIAVELLRGSDDASRIAELEALGERMHLPCVAAGDAHMHERARKRLQDVMSAIRLQCPLAEVGRKLHPNGERYLRSIGRL